MNKVLEHNKPKKAHTQQVRWDDYVCTDKDMDIIGQMLSEKEDKILVDINGAFVDRYHMDYLSHPNTRLNGDVVSAYIHCLRAEQHLLHRDGGKVFLENTFIASLLKRDGTLREEQISYTTDTIETRVDNYLDHDMVFLPINIKYRWYLAFVNAA